MHQYDPLLSAQVNHFDKHQAVPAASVSSRPFMTGPTPETILPIEPSYLSKQLWSDEVSSIIINLLDVNITLVMSRLNEILNVCKKTIHKFYDMEKFAVFYLLEGSPMA